VIVGQVDHLSDFIEVMSNHGTRLVAHGFSREHHVREICTRALRQA
jgi:hypothetical protein